MKNMWLKRGVLNALNTLKTVARTSVGIVGFTEGAFNMPSQPDRFAREVEKAVCLPGVDVLSTTLASLLLRRQFAAIRRLVIANTLPYCDSECRRRVLAALDRWWKGKP